MLKSQISDVYIVSMYCLPSFGIESGISQLSKIYGSLKGAKILVGMDANARSPLWQGSVSDERGLLLEEFLAESG